MDQYIFFNWENPTHHHSNANQPPSPLPRISIYFSYSYCIAPPSLYHTLHLKLGESRETSFLAFCGDVVVGYRVPTVHNPKSLCYSICSAVDGDETIIVDIVFNKHVGLRVCMHLCFMVFHDPRPFLLIFNPPRLHNEHHYYS